MVSLLTRLAIRLPRWVVVMALALAFMSIALSVKRLEFKTNRSDLLNPDTQFQTRWLEYVHEFGITDDVLVVVSADRPASIRRAIDHLGAELRQRPDLFRDVHDRFDQDLLVGKGLFYLAAQDVVTIQQRVEQLLPLLEATTEPLHWHALLGDQSPHRVDWRDVVTAALADPDSYSSPWPFSAIEDKLREQLPSYPLIDNGTLGIVSMHLVPSTNEFVQGAEPIRELRRIARQVAATHAGVDLGVTGLPVVEYDEMSTSQHDMMLASVLALCLVGVLFYLGLGNLRYPMAAIAALLIGIIWTCGYLTLTLGHLNILSMSFGVILIGLGVDFAIHYVARYSALTASGVEPESAILSTSLTVGPAIAVGGITTALAFFSTSLTEFLGVAELGTIAGGGILLCMLSTLLVLPAILSLQRPPPRRTNGSPFDLWNTLLLPLWQRPRSTVVWGLGITLLLAIGLPRLNYDHNLLNLQARGLASVAWEQRLISGSDRSIWYAVSLAATREELDRRRKAFLRRPSVQRVDDLSELLPVTTAAQREAIRQIHDRLHDLSSAPPTLLPIDASQLPPELMATTSAAFDPSASQAPANPSERPNAEWLRRIDLMRARVVSDLWRQMQALKRVSNPAPPVLADLPAGIQSRFVGRSGVRMMRVYARGDSWETEALRRFVDDVTQVDPLATGAPLQTYYASQQMQRSYLRATVYTAFAVIAVLWCDLRRADLVALAALPTVCGIVQLFGIMGLLDIPLNPANVIVFPLILGIGIDDGIHVMHDLRERKKLHPATTHGIVMTSLTSMIGFGSLMLAQHEGLRSLGRVVTLGITCCLISSIVWLPCVMALLSRLRAARRRMRTADRRTATSMTSHRPQPSVRS